MGEIRAGKSQEELLWVIQFQSHRWQQSFLKVNKTGVVRNQSQAQVLMALPPPQMCELGQVIKSPKTHTI